jgi:ATP-dependent helicase/nuclease subunit A
MEWTEQQQKTIDERDKNILVSAAAGSGKTAVLVERIKKMVTEEGVPIDKMLIVTFTNAAAAEMREKIRRALKERVRETPALKTQLELMSRASISTFHAFALDVIHNFFYLIDLEPDFSICDEAQSTVIGEEALDELLESRFEADDKAFYSFLDWYGSERSNDDVRTIIRDVHKALMALPDPFGTFDARISELELDPQQYTGTPAAIFMKNDITTRVKKAAGFADQAYEVLCDEGLEKMAEKFSSDRDALRRMAESNSFAAIAEGVSDFAWTRMTATKDEKPGYEMCRDRFGALRDNAKKELKKLADSYFGEPLQEQLQEVHLVSGQARTLQGLVKDYHELFLEKKRELKLVDFNDIEHYCLQILTSDGAAEFYREKFSYIFVDEYQDTSLLQEAIIDKISRKNNLFMVGDIKQSIYKFRLAEPEIFKEKYDRYAGCGDGTSLKIDLNNNFRSKAPILSGINRLFRDIMDGYDDDACLYPGISYAGAYVFEPQLKLIDTSAAEDVDEAIEEMASMELEAMEMCRLIRENLGEPYFDSKLGEDRKLQYRDMVILMRSVSSSASVLFEIMRSQGIPIYIDDNQGYFDTMEINVFMNLLAVIDNRFQDVPFISVLRSEIFGFSTDELARVRAEVPEDPYVQAFLDFASGEGGFEELRTKCRRTAEQIDIWKKIALSMPLPEFMWKLMLDTGYYLVMGTMPDGSQRQANLRALIDKTEGFSESGQSSLYSFIRYIDTVKKNKVSVGQVKLLGENDDVVRVMTIHKSKGLEFPMVIVGGMGRKLMYSKAGSRVLFHKDVGLGMYLEDPQGHCERKTLPYKIILSKTHQEEFEEHIRVLYVALTRAREKLFMTGTVKDTEKFLAGKDSGATGDTSFLAMLTELPEYEVIGRADLAPGGEGTGNVRVSSLDVEEDAAGHRLVWERMGYAYPYAEASAIRSKYSVSSLNKADQGHPQETAGAETDIHLETPKFLQEERRLTMAEKGTIYHGLMERVDFSRAAAEGESYLREAAADYVRKGIFLENEIRSIDFNKIVKFFGSDMGRRCVRAFNAGKLRRELPFNLKMKISDEEVIVQGIIDCCFEEDGAIVLLDYKTNWIDADKPFEEEKARLQGLYSRQLEIYAEALNKAGSARVRESYLYLFSAGRLIEVNRYE